MSQLQASTALLSLVQVLSCSQKWKYIWRRWMTLEKQLRYLSFWNLLVQVSTEANKHILKVWTNTDATSLTPQLSSVTWYWKKNCVLDTTRFKLVFRLGISSFHCFIPAKLDPPMIIRVETVPKRNGCLKLRWALEQHQAWVSEQRLNLEVRLKPADSNEWNEQPVSTKQSSPDTVWTQALLVILHASVYLESCLWFVSKILLSQVKPTKPVEQCRLLHGTRYFAQIRVRYKSSPWSEWSRSQSGVTLETGKTQINLKWHNQSL